MQNPAFHGTIKSRWRLVIVGKNQEKKAAKAAKKAGLPVPEAAKSAVAKVVTERAAKQPKVVKEGALPALPKLPSAAKSRKPKPTRECQCGCGGQTTSIWVPGHDARAKGWALRIERGILTMKDVPENEQQGAKFMLKQRKDLGTTGKITLHKGKTTEPKAEPESVTEPVAEEVATDAVNQ